MSIIDKQTFASEMSKRLSDKLTAKDVELVVGEIMSQLAHYDMLRRNDDYGKQDFEDMLKLFADTKRIEGRSEKTMEHYLYILRRFHDYNNTPIREITVFHIRQFL